jgi:hypothetical protein
VGDGKVNRAEGRQSGHAAVLTKEVMPATPHVLLLLYLAGKLVETGCGVHFKILKDTPTSGC